MTTRSATLLNDNCDTRLCRCAMQCATPFHAPSQKPDPDASAARTARFHDQDLAGLDAAHFRQAAGAEEHHANAFAGGRIRVAHDLPATRFVVLSIWRAPSNRKKAFPPASSSAKSRESFSKERSHLRQERSLGGSGALAQHRIPGNESRHIAFRSHAPSIVGCLRCGCDYCVHDSTQRRLCRKNQLFVFR